MSEFNLTYNDGIYCWTRTALSHRGNKVMEIWVGSEVSPERLIIVGGDNIQKMSAQPDTDCQKDNLKVR